MKTHNCCPRGNTVTEYGIIFSLCAVLAIGGLIALRNAVMAMNINVNNSLANGGTISLITPKGPTLETLKFGNYPAASDLPLGDAGHFEINQDPQTGDWRMDLKPGSGPTNATSVDGQPVLQDLFTLALALEQIKDKYPNSPEVQGLADAAYRIMAETGTLGATRDAFQEHLSIEKNTSQTIEIEKKIFGKTIKVKQTVNVPTEVSYHNLDALNDLKVDRLEIYALAANPPSVLSTEEQAQVKILAAEIFNISQLYIDMPALQPFINSNQDFNTQANSNNIIISAEVDNDVTTAGLASIRECASIEELKQLGSSYLAQSGLSSSKPVEIVLGDARQLDGAQ